MGSLRTPLRLLLIICVFLLEYAYSDDLLNYALFSQFGGPGPDSASGRNSCICMFNPTPEIVVRDDDFYIAGTTSTSIYETTGTSGTDVFIARYSKNVTLIYGTQFGSGTYDGAYSLLVPQNISPSYVFMSFVYNYTAGVACYDENLQIEWFQLYGDYYGGRIFRLAFDPIDYVLWGVGTTNQSFPSFGQVNQGGKDAWLVQIDPITGDATNMILFGTSTDDYYWSIDISTNLNLDARIFTLGFSVTSSDTSVGFLSTYSTYSSTLLNNIWLDTTQAVNPADLKVLPSQDKILIVGDFAGTLDVNGAEGGIDTNGAMFATVISASDITASPYYLTVFNSNLTTTIEVHVKDDYAVILAQQDANGFFAGVGSVGLMDILLVVINTTEGSQIDASLFGTQLEDEAWGLSVVSKDEVWAVGDTAGALGPQSYGQTDVFIGDFYTSKPHGSKKGLSTDVIIAIVVPIGAVGIIAAGVVGFLLYRRRRQAEPVNIPGQRRQMSTDYECSIKYDVTHFETVGVMVSTATTGAMPIASKPHSPTVSVPSDQGSNHSTSFANSSFKESSQDEIKKAKQSSLKNDWVIEYSEIKVEKKIGEGAFGEVFKGKWRGIHVAVKQMAITGAEDKLKVQDFFAEAQLMKQLQPHSNITQLIGVCSSPICIITEFVANGSLYAWLQSDKAMDDNTKMEIIKGTAAGMLHLHRQGVIHRDLAARNILLDKTMSPKVADFGMSRVALDNATNRTEASVGPIKWMAPEALIERTYNKKTDVWSFGVTIYEILTRESPYKDHNLMQIGASVALGKLSLIPDLEARAHLYPKLAVDIGKSCLQFNAKDRPTFEEIVDRLDSEST